MFRSSRVVLFAAAAAAAAAVSGCTPKPAAAPPSATPPAIAALQGWCADVPRPANKALPVAPVASDWFEVVEAATGVYAFVEPYQFQEAVSYLIVGSKQALMFDTGIGMMPLRPLVEQLTRLPVTVINSHTHYDHVGGNWEFDRILAIDSPYTRANLAGFPHENLATEVAPSAFCKGAPAGLDTAAFRTRPWKATGVIKDGDVIDLGGRTIEVLQVPGHTPDATALLDRTNGLLWTGDTYYKGALWLYVPETDPRRLRALDGAAGGADAESQAASSRPQHGQCRAGTAGRGTWRGAEDADGQICAPRGRVRRAAHLHH